MDSQKNITSKSEPSTPPLSRSAQRALDSARQLAAAQQKRLLGLLAIGVALNAIIAFILYDYLVIERESDRLEQLSQMQLDTRAAGINSFITEQNQQLDQLATTPELLASVENLATPLESPVSPLAENTKAGQPETDPVSKPKEAFEFTQLQQKLANATPMAIKVRVIPLDTATLEQESEFPLSFAELNLIRRAEQRAPTPPELITRNNEWVINFIRPLPLDAKTDVRATLLVTLNAKDLLKALSAGEMSAGETLLLQQFPASPSQTIQSLGAGGAGPSLESKIKGTFLNIKFTPSPALAQEAEELPTLWLLCIGLIAAASLALILLINRVLNRREKISSEDFSSTVEHKVAITKAASSSETLSSPLFQPHDVLDIAMIDEDADILGLQDATGKKSNAAAKVKINESDVPLEIFRSYDIRGLVPSQITPDFAFRLGQAIGSEAIDQGEQSLIVARDGRTHSQKLTEALIKGILGTGCNVINIGIVPTPLMYFASFHFDDSNSGVMVTASHNPKEYNGFKVVMNNRALADEAVLELRARIISQRIHQGAGVESERPIIPDYIDRIFSDVALAGNVSLVIDAGNAVPGLVAPALFDELGCEVTELFCDLDGEFPNHNPDPTDANNLQALIAKVQEVNADLGVAFDGDGDRLVVVTPKGDIIWPDRLLMLFAKDILARNPGADVLFDVKCSRQLNQVISSYGGRPIMWKTGHSPMKAKMEETDALIGGEYSGHIFIKDRWYGFDDGIYAMARLLEIITLRDQKIDEIFAAFPQLISTPELKIAIAESEKFGFMQKLVESSDFNNGNLTTIDGLRVDYTKGWGLVRASNTSPALTLRFEAETQDALEKIQQIFKRELLKIDSNLTLNF